MAGRNLFPDAVQQEQPGKGRNLFPDAVKPFRPFAADQMDTATSEPVSMDKLSEMQADERARQKRERGLVYNLGKLRHAKSGKDAMDAIVAIDRVPHRWFDQAVQAFKDDPLGTSKAVGVGAVDGVTLSTFDEAAGNTATNIDDILGKDKSALDRVKGVVNYVGAGLTPFGNAAQGMVREHQERNRPQTISEMITGEREATPYSRTVGMWRDAQDEALETHPGFYIAGNLAGGSVLPGGAVKNGAGLVEGAVSAVGRQAVKRSPTLARAATAIDGAGRMVSGAVQKYTPQAAQHLGRYGANALQSGARTTDAALPFIAGYGVGEARGGLQERAMGGASAVAMGAPFALALGAGGGLARPFVRKATGGRFIEPLDGSVAGVVPNALGAPVGPPTLNMSPVTGGRATVSRAVKGPDRRAQGVIVNILKSAGVRSTDEAEVMLQRAIQLSGDDAARPQTVAQALIKEYGAKYGDLETKLMDYGLYAASKSGAGDASRTTMLKTMQDLRSSQGDYLTATLEENLGKGKLISREDSIVRDLRKTGREGYDKALADVGDTPEAREAAIRLEKLLSDPVRNQYLPKHIITAAELDGMPIQLAQDRNPLKVAHALQSRLRELADDATDWTPQGPKTTSEGRLYLKMREDILRELEAAAPGYQKARKTYGEDWGAKEAVRFGDKLLTAAAKEYEIDRLMRRFQELSPKQKAVARMSIRDAIANELRKGGEDAAARITRLRSTGALDAITRVPNAKSARKDRGGNVAGAIRRIDEENRFISKFDPRNGSDTQSKLQRTGNAVDSMQSPIMRSARGMADAPYWGTIAADAFLMSNGHPPYVTVTKVATKIANRLAEPRPKTRSAVTDTLFGLRPANPDVPRPPNSGLPGPQFPFAVHGEDKTVLAAFATKGEADDFARSVNDRSGVIRNGLPFPAPLGPAAGGAQQSPAQPQLMAPPGGLSPQDRSARTASMVVGGQGAANNPLANADEKPRAIEEIRVRAMAEKPMMAILVAIDEGDMDGLRILQQGYEATLTTPEARAAYERALAFKGARPAYAGSGVATGSARMQ